MIAVILLVLVIGLGFLFGAFDAYEAFYQFTRLHEDWELDEIVLMIPAALAVVAVVAWRRSIQYRREARLRERAEQEVERALAEAVRQEQMRQEFMVHVSHELNGPVNGIMGMLQLLAAEDDPHQAHVDIDLALASARTLKQIISSVITFVDLDKDNVASGFEYIRARELVDACLDRFMPLAREKGIDLAGTVEPGVPERICSHRALLQLILDNLVSNAVRYTDQGRVDVAVRHVAAGGELVLAVADTGRGIGREEQDRIFARYYRGGASSGAADEGLGLGLSLVRHALDLLDGRVELESSSGTGSRFTVFIPLRG